MSFYGEAAQAKCSMFYSCILNLLQFIFVQTLAEAVNI